MKTVKQNEMLDMIFFMSGIGFLCILVLLLIFGYVIESVDFLHSTILYSCIKSQSYFVIGLILLFFFAVGAFGFVIRINGKHEPKYIEKFLKKNPSLRDVKDEKELVKDELSRSYYNFNSHPVRYYSNPVNNQYGRPTPESRRESDQYSKDIDKYQKSLEMLNEEIDRRELSSI
ncbi:hypothetical protein FACS189428_6220 [Clostridia bacterium]|nr:hypothetical protein FACS189428_6220 [Clostridia bacterium]